MYFNAERIKRILDELSGNTYCLTQPVSEFKMKEGKFVSTQEAVFDTSEWDTLKKDERWGGMNKNYWFYTEVIIPESFSDRPVVLKISTSHNNLGDWDATNPQFLLYINGKPVQGIDLNHKEALLTDNAVAGDVFKIALHSHSGMKDSLSELISTISVLDKDTEQLYYDIKVPYDYAILLGKDDKRRLDILNILNDTINILDLRKPFSESYNQSVKDAISYLQQNFYEKMCGKDEITAICVGHTHIDVAWLWRLAETREKTVRSFSTVLNLMKQYPEYIFMSSQPQLYQFLKERHPKVLENIKERVKEGRWEPEGAMWLEADCNLTSGESLVRQIMFGTRFFREEFGVENRILWLPDVFGYSAALPQILKKSGIDYFMTTKISWNEYNKMPYDSFMWRGIDGTEILTHFITTRDAGSTDGGTFTTYNGMINPTQVLGAWERYQQKDLNNEILICYGYGDGGGGPTKEMLENGKRLEKGLPGCPQVKMGKAIDFFTSLEKNAASKKRFPKWVGELYLEYHRGTYTSMARNKKFNRKSELLYQSAELLSSISMLEAASPSYPQAELNEGWRGILLNQFHDILPGSSIKEVYEDSKEQYLEILEKGNNLVSAKAKEIAKNINIDSTSLVVFNQLGFVRNDVIEFALPESWENAEVYDWDGNKITSQLTMDGKVIFHAAGIPAKGYKTYKIKMSVKTGSKTGSLTADKNLLSNSFYNITLDNDGNLTFIYDKLSKREVLKPNERGNVLQAFEDKPHNFDAWDINIYYQDKMWEVNDVVSAEVVEEGPVRASLKITKRFMDSTITQTIQIYSELPRIDFVNHIDWKESQILLKAAFPVDIHTDKATYEIQYGNVERPTHWNTSWDYARFEVCAHKWADLSEGDYGVSILNDCKYGHEIKDGNIRLTLLKSATYPNPDADKEVHDFTYSIYPHTGDWKTAGTVQAAYELNCPAYTMVEAAHGGNLPSELSLVSLDQDNVMIEVVKKAEDSNDIIIRVYECYNRRTTAKFTFLKDISAAGECDLMENNIESLEFSKNSFSFEIKPYEIKTFKLKV